MKLHFPALNGGVESGLNDAGIETFEGDFAGNTIRECAQNSLDAASVHDQPVRLTLTRMSVPRTSFPFIDELCTRLNACLSYWTKHEKAKSFFTEALRSVSGPSIDVLKVSDYNTTGVGGNDDDTTSPWFGLVKSRGVSNKTSSDSGGAFGIGKDAPLAGSSVRTVIYSTMTHKGAVALQGVSRLVTHKDGDGTRTQGTGFIGDFNDATKSYVAIRDSAHIPKLFQRDTAGLDVWIIGATLIEGWVRPFIRSAIANFWPAIAKNRISFQIGDVEISASTLPKLMHAEKTDSKVKEALPYYQSTIDPHAKKISVTLDKAGLSHLSLLGGARDLPGKIAMVRRTGMIIQTYAPRVGFMPFSGLYECESENGNKLLRSLEPPRHDKWDAGRGAPEARAALKEIKDWIKEEVRKLTPHVDEDEINEDEVPPDLLEDVPENPMPEDEQANNEPDLGGQPKTAEPPKALSIPVKSVWNQAQGNSDVDDNPGRSISPKGGDGKATGGKVSERSTKDGTHGQSPKPRSLRFRAFRPAGEEETITAVIRSSEDFEGRIAIRAVGDNGGSDDIRIISAYTDARQPLEVDGCHIKALKLQKDIPVKIHIRTEDSRKLSLEAHTS